MELVSFCPLFSKCFKSVFALFVNVCVSPYISYVLPFSLSHSEESSEEEEEEKDDSDESPLSPSESDTERSGDSGQDSDDMEAEEVRGHAADHRVIVLPANFYIQYITLYGPMYGTEVGCSPQPSFIMCRTKPLSRRCTLWVTETVNLSINSVLRLRYFHAFSPLPSLQIFLFRSILL